eukprot:CFRG0795T1
MISNSYLEWDELFSQYVQFPTSAVDRLSTPNVRVPPATTHSTSNYQQNHYQPQTRINNGNSTGLSDKVYMHICDSFDKAWDSLCLSKKSVPRLVFWVFDAMNSHSEHPYRVNVLAVVLDHAITKKVVAWSQVTPAWGDVFTPHHQHVWKAVNELLDRRLAKCTHNDVTAIFRHICNQLKLASTEHENEMQKHVNDKTRHMPAHAYLNTDPYGHNTGGWGDSVDYNTVVAHAEPVIARIMRSSELVPQFVVFHEAYRVKNICTHWMIRQHNDAVIEQFQALVNMIRPVSWYHPAIIPVVTLTSNIMRWRVYDMGSLLFPMRSKLYSMAVENVSSSENDDMIQLLCGVLSQYGSTIGLRNFVKENEHTKIKSNRRFQAAIAETILNVLEAEQTQLAQTRPPTSKHDQLRKTHTSKDTYEQIDARARIQPLPRDADGCDVDVDREWRLLASQLFALLRVEELDMDLVLRLIHKKIRAKWGLKFRSNRVVWLVHQTAFSEELKKNFKTSYTRVNEVPQVNNSGETEKATLYDLLFSLYDYETTNATMVEDDKWQIQDLSLEFLLRRLYPEQSTAALNDHPEMGLRLHHPRRMLKQISELTKITASRILAGETMSDADLKRIAMLTFGTDTGGPVSVLWSYIAAQGKGTMPTSNGSVMEYTGMAAAYTIDQLSHLSVYAAIRFMNKFKDHVLREQQDSVLSPGAVETYVKLHLVIGAACMPMVEVKDEMGVVINLLNNLVPRALSGTRGIDGIGASGAPPIDQWAVVSVCMLLETVAYQLLSFCLSDPNVVYRLHGILCKILGETTNYKMYQLAEVALTKLSACGRRHHFLPFLRNIDSTSKRNGAMDALPESVRRLIVVLYSKMLNFPSELFHGHNLLNDTVRLFDNRMNGMLKTTTTKHAGEQPLPKHTGSVPTQSQFPQKQSHTAANATAPVSHAPSLTSSVEDGNESTVKAEETTTSVDKRTISSTLIGSKVNHSPMTHLSAINPGSTNGTSSHVASILSTLHKRKPFDYISEGLSNFVLPSLNVRWAPQTLNLFPSSIQAYYRQLNKTDPSATPASTIPVVSVQRIEEEKVVKINERMLSTNNDDPAEVIQYYQSQNMRPLFLCMVWAMVKMIRTRNIQIRIKFGTVKSVLLSFTPQEMGTFTQTLIGYILQDEATKITMTTTTTTANTHQPTLAQSEKTHLQFVSDLLSEMIWQKHILRFEHVIDALMCCVGGTSAIQISALTPESDKVGINTSGSVDVIDKVSIAALEIASNLLAANSQFHVRVQAYVKAISERSSPVPVPMTSEVGAGVGVNTQSQTRADKETYNQKLMRYLNAYPEYTNFEACVEATPPISTTQQTFPTVLPCYYDNAVCRFIPALDMVLGRLIEFGKTDVVFMLVSTYGSLYAVHDRPVSSVYEFLHYYHANPYLTQNIKEAMVNGLVAHADMGGDGEIQQGMTNGFNKRSNFSKAFLGMLKEPTQPDTSTPQTTYAAGTYGYKSNSTKIDGETVSAYMEKRISSLSRAIHNKFHTSDEGVGGRGEFANHKTRHTVVQCVELMCLRGLSVNEVTDALLTSVVRPRSGAGVVNVMERINTTALLLVSLPWAYRNRFFSVLAECILGNEWLLERNIAGVDDDFDDGNICSTDMYQRCYENENDNSVWTNPNRWEGQMAVPMIYLTLTQAIFRHGPDQWPAMMPRFYNAFLDEERWPESEPMFGITKPSQLLYLCHLIGPTIDSMSAVPTNAKWPSHTNDDHYSLGLVFMELMRLFLQVNNAVVNCHGTYRFPCTSTERIINFLYYIKYNYAFEKYVWDDAQNLIHLFDTPLRTRLRFLKRSSG